MSPDIKLPGADDLVEARRKAGYGTVSASVPNLSTPNPNDPVAEGHIVQMRFREAVEREDFEPVGWELITAADLVAAEEG